MDNTPNTGWEPSPDKMGNWRAMFEPGGARHHGRDAARHPGGTPPARDAAPGLDDSPDPLALDPANYRPWVLQRGRSRPVMLLSLSRFDPRSSLWQGWQLAYHSLIAVEYIGDRMLSLDFGMRQFMIEGQGLSELTRHLQDGTVLALNEYSQAVWPARGSGPIITSIKRLGGDPKAT